MLPLGDGLGDRHIMVDERLLERICDAGKLTSEDTVLEVGAGTGELTERILDKGCRVVAFEKDRRFYSYLETSFKGRGKLTLIGGDALKCELPKFNKVVSNLPYSISKKITIRLLKAGFDLAVLVYQREFAEKLVAKPESDNYRFISALAQSFCDVEISELVRPESFRPQPNVLSAVVVFTPTCEFDEEYVSYLQDLFNHKNKLIRNIVNGYDGEFAGSRPVDLSPNDFKKLYSEKDFKYLKR